MAILEVIAHHNLAGGDVEAVVGFMHTDAGARAEIHDLDERKGWNIESGNICEYYVVDMTDAAVGLFNAGQQKAYGDLIDALNRGVRM